MGVPLVVFEAAVKKKKKPELSARTSVQKHHVSSKLPELILISICLAGAKHFCIYRTDALEQLHKVEGCSVCCWTGVEKPGVMFALQMTHNSLNG